MKMKWKVYRPTVSRMAGLHKVIAGCFETEAGSGEDLNIEASASLALDLAIKRRKEGRTDNEAAVSGTWVVVGESSAFAFEVSPPPVQPAYSRKALR